MNPSALPNLSALGAAALLLAGCAGSGSNSQTAAEYATSVKNVKQISLGVLLYANDYDDELPLGASWMTGLGPYLKNNALFHSPAVPTGDYGYALNSAIAGTAETTITAPATTIMVFDSTDLKFNASDPTTTLPSPPRYGSKNTIGYADGHVQDSNLITP